MVGPLRRHRAAGAGGRRGSRRSASGRGPRTSGRHGVERNGPTIYALSGIDIALWDIAASSRGCRSTAARRRRARRPARVREPAALRQGGRRRLLHRAGAQARLSRHQAARDHRAGGEGRARTSPVPARGSCSTRTVRGRSSRRRDGANGWRAARPALAGGAGVPARERGRAREVRNKGGIPTAAGENYGTVWDFRRAFEAGPSTTRSERDQDRGVASCAGYRARRDVRRHRRAALGLFRSGPPGVDPLHRRDARETLIRALLLRLREEPARDAINPVNGRIAVPQGPGLGVDPDPRML